MLKLLALLAFCGLAVPVLSVGGRSGGRRLGGWNPANTNDDGVVAAAQYAFEQLQRRDNGMFALKMAGIVSAEQQIVAGIKYRVTLAVHTTNCCAGPEVDLSTCLDPHAAVRHAGVPQSLGPRRRHARARLAAVLSQDGPRARVGVNNN